jgi:signal transduction histidine kinase/CheY-like chemotaxis protein
MPTTNPNPEAITPFQALAVIACAAIAATVLIGWTVGSQAMTRVLAGSIAMNPMTAVSILAISGALILRGPAHARKVGLIGGIVAFIGIAKLLQLATGQPSGIDQLLFADQLAQMAGTAPNRMAPNTAFAISAIGIGLALSRSTRSRVVVLSQCLCVLSAMTAAAALGGYALDEVALYQVHTYIAMAFSTGIALFSLSIAVITTNPGVGVMRLFSDRGPAGTLARTAVPLALLVPVIASVLGLAGERAGYYGTEAAVAISLFANVLVNFVLLGGSTVALYRSDVERQEREAAVTRSENQYRQAEKAGYLGYWKLELPGKGVQWSDGFARICAIPQGVAPSLDAALAVYHPDDAILVKHSIAEAEEFGTDWEFACRVCRSDGSIRYVKSYGVCERDELGRTRELFGVISDVTDLEIARRDAEAAKAATASFLANMSHEIRTPMNGMMGFVELLLESELDSGQRRHLALVQSSANALLKLLNDILDLSKIEAGRLEIAEAPYNLRHGIKECVRLMNPMAEQKGLSLTLAIEDDFPPYLLVDGLRVRQILLNLIGNAIKFTHRGSISVGIAAATAPDGQRLMRASVKDSGIGIHPDRRATIFGAFVQAEATTSRRFGGSGLGLSISRQLADMMGGTIEVDSALGEGTTMTLTIPLVESAEPEISDEPEAAAVVVATRQLEHRQASILLVEDVDINQELFSEMLTKLGHKFHFASNGAEAVEWAKRLEADPEAWDMILMDLQMPVMDGLTATRAIRAAGGRGASIPIIALTASAFEEERRECEAAGMNDHLAKPVGIEALRRIINRWLGTPEAKPGGDVPARSASLDRKIKARLRSSAEQLEEIVAKVAGANPDQLAALMVEARKIVHVLAGTAGMVGEEELGDQAAATEEKIAGWAKRPSAPGLIEAKAAIESLVAALTVERRSGERRQAGNA